jgi:hypothetical protein
MKVAGRLKPCAHMGCFDLETFVSINERTHKVCFIYSNLLTCICVWSCLSFHSLMLNIPTLVSIFFSFQ